MEKKQSNQIQTIIIQIGQTFGAGILGLIISIAALPGILAAGGTAPCNGDLMCMGAKFIAACWLFMAYAPTTIGIFSLIGCFDI